MSMNNESSQLDKLLKAASFASRAHGGQLRKDGRTPYVSHPFRVALILSQLFRVTSSEVLAAAVLHDVVEDTATDYDEVAEKFGGQVADWVSFLSKDKRLEETEKEERYRNQLAEAPVEVKLIKLADIYDNLHDSAHLDRSKAQKSLDKAKAYMDVLRQDSHSQLVMPLRLLDETIAAHEQRFQQ